MTSGLPRAGYVLGKATERICECPTPNVFEDDFGVCVKCGHQAEPEPPTTPSWARNPESAA
jgi:hypothetical protein